jgi:uncharacterized membrane protein YfcA
VSWHGGGVLVLVVAGVVVAAGALVQGAVGFGLALVAAPLLAIVDPDLVPVPLLLCTGGHAVMTLARERGDVDWSGVGWALAGRLPGIALGVLLVSVLPPRPFLAAVAAIVLTCALLSTLRWRPRPTPPALLVAGLVSGVSGTAAAIDGPQIALLYQDEAGARVRATMAAYFTVGAVLSVGGLLVGGRVTGDHLVAAAALLPFVVAGFLLSGPVRRVLDRGWVRPAVLVVSVGGAVVLLVRAAVG